MISIIQKYTVLTRNLQGFFQVLIGRPDIIQLLLDIEFRISDPERYTTFGFFFSYAKKINDAKIHDNTFLIFHLKQRHIRLFWPKSKSCLLHIRPPFCDIRPYESGNMSGVHLLLREIEINTYMIKNTSLMNKLFAE